MTDNKRKPRYTLASITTLDADLLIKADTVRHMGYSHEDIYKAGLDYLSKEKS